MFNFLHLELTSRCNKSCFMCGRRKLEREYPHLCDWGDMDYEMVRAIQFQVPKGTLVQFHNNGEPLLYPFLGDVLRLFQGHIRCLDTNGKLLLERAEEIIGNLETLTVSVIQDDPEGEEQYEIVSKFLGLKGDNHPSMVYRLLGKVDERPWDRLPGRVARRILHSPDGSFNYQKKTTIPEFGICQEILTHLAIDRHGYISMCVRFDPKGDLKIGHIGKISLAEAWASPKRKKYLEYHIAGRRAELPGCRDCDYWGIPRGD